MYNEVAVVQPLLKESASFEIWIPQICMHGMRFSSKSMCLL